MHRMQSTGHARMYFDNSELTLCSGGSMGSRLDCIDVPATRYALQTARRLARDAAAGAKLGPAQQVCDAAAAGMPDVIA